MTKMKRRRNTGRGMEKTKGIQEEARTNLPRSGERRQDYARTVPVRDVRGRRRGKRRRTRRRRRKRRRRRRR